MIRRLALLDLVVLVACAAVALAEAVDTSFDAQPAVGIAGILGIAAAIPLGLRSRLLAPACGLYVLATYYTLDRYYTHTRFSQEDAVPWWWMYGLLAVSLASLRIPRAGSALALVWLGTLVALGVGH